MSRRPARAQPHPDLELERAADRALAAGDLEAAGRLLFPEPEIQVDRDGKVVAWSGYRAVPRGDAPGRFLTNPDGSPVLLRTYTPVKDDAVYRRVYARLMQAILTRLLAAIDRRTA